MRKPTQSPRRLQSRLSSDYVPNLYKFLQSVLQLVHALGASLQPLWYDVEKVGRAVAELTLDMVDDLYCSVSFRKRDFPPLVALRCGCIATLPLSPAQGSCCPCCCHPTPLKNFVPTRNDDPFPAHSG